MQAESFRSGRRHGNDRSVAFLTMAKAAKRAKKPRASAGGPAHGLWYLKQWRQSKGRQWTQQYLADLMNTTKGTVSKLENGELDMSAERIKSYAEAFGVHPADLLRPPGGASEGKESAEAASAPSGVELRHVWTVLRGVSFLALAEIEDQVARRDLASRAAEVLLGLIQEPPEETIGASQDSVLSVRAVDAFQRCVDQALRERDQA